MKILTLLLIFHSLPAMSSTVLNFATIDYCPFTCQGNMEKPGIAIEILEKILKGTDYELSVSFLSLKRAKSAMTSNRVHGLILGSKVQFPNNFFPKIPAISQPVVFFKNKELDWTFKGISSLKNKRVGAIQGFKYNHTKVANFLEKSKNVIWLNHIGAHNRAFNLMELKRLDLFIAGSYVTQYKLGTSKNRSHINQTSSAISYFDNYISLTSKLDKREREKLLKLFDSKMKELKETRKLREIYLRYSIIDSSL